MPARFAAVVACAASLAACGLEQPPPSTAQLPPYFYGTWIDNDIGAINEAAYALGAPSQAVVNTLIWAMWQLEHGDQAAAMKVFASPLFLQPPDRTWAVLNDLPYLPAARVATADAEQQEFRDG